MPSRCSGYSLAALAFLCQLKQAVPYPPRRWATWTDQALRGMKPGSLALAYARLSDVEDDLLSALSPAERATLYDLLVRAVGAKSPPCNAADEPPPCPV